MQRSLSPSATTRDSLTVTDRSAFTTHARTRVACLLLAACGALLWVVSLRQVDLARMSDLGLVSVLPLSFYLSLVILTTGFCLTIRHRQVSTGIALIHIIILICILYGTPAIVEKLPRIEATWRHAGVTDYIMRRGQVDPFIDAYFNWPGFFALSAFVTEVAGFASPLSFAAWMSLVFNLLYLGPLLIILRSTGGDGRLVWLGAWLFYGTNWVGQDHFAPQAFGYLLSLVVLSILMKWFKRPIFTVRADHTERYTLGLRRGVLRWIRNWLDTPDAPNAPSTPVQRTGLMAIAIILIIVVVFSHQLTPFALLTSLGIITVSRRCDTRDLVVLVGVLTAAWLVFVATPYLAGHVRGLVGDVGDVQGAVSQNLAGRVRGSSQHLVVVYVRILMTVAIWTLALFGGIRSLGNGYRDLTFALLALAPFPMFVLQSYGGEMVLRIYLFALPFMAFFAAAFFFATPTSSSSWYTTLGVGAASVILLCGFLVARYGNERMDYFTPDEVAAVTYFYDVAPPSASLIIGGWNMPRRFQDYEKHDFISLGRIRQWRDPGADDSMDGVLQGIEQLMRSEQAEGSYILITQGQKDAVRLLGGGQAGYDRLTRLQQALLQSSAFKLIYSNGDATLFTLATTRPEPAQ